LAQESCCRSSRIEGRGSRPARCERTPFVGIRTHSAAFLIGVSACWSGPPEQCNSSPRDGGSPQNNESITGRPQDGDDGTLVYYFPLDSANYASTEIAVRKARSAATFRVPTKVFADVNATNASVSTLHPAAVASPGRIPIVVDGKIIGAIGVSGFPAGVLDHALAEAILTAAK
jgi:uncharacterized protein GlcG (DUF336 family)